VLALAGLLLLLRAPRREPPDPDAAAPERRDPPIRDFGA
jgi:hypothetical protein